jgi:DNA-binding transcriptional MocR family regulator
MSFAFALSRGWSHKVASISSHVRLFATEFSQRGKDAVSLLPTYLADARAVQKYSPITPDGALQLSVAENQMLEDLLVPVLSDLSSSDFKTDCIYYQPTQGREPLRMAMALYLQRLLGLSKNLNASNLVVGAGCNAVLENLCFCLTQPGDAVMIPTPYYAAFEFDLGARAGEQLEKASFCRLLHLTNHMIFWNFAVFLFSMNFWCSLTVQVSLLCRSTP